MARVLLALALLIGGTAGLVELAGGLDRPLTPRATARVAEPLRTLIPGAPGQPTPPRPTVGFSQSATPAIGFQHEPYPFLPDEESSGSRSLGSVTEGWLVGAREVTLPAPHLRILPRQLMRHLRFTSDEMHALLHEAAVRVGEEHPGSVLWLGNLGRRGGGDIPWSVSHNSGRDADLAFYFVDEAGQPLSPPDLIAVGSDRTYTYEGRVYHFDLARNWALVRALLESDAAQIQFLFISNPLKSALISYARANREPARLIARANVVMSQPGRSNPHDDHLHVRIYCSRRDVAAGCRNTGRLHGWVDTSSGARAQRIRQVEDFLDAEDPEQRARAIERLVLLEADSAWAEIASLLTDDSARVRRAAARAIGHSGRRQFVDRVIEVSSAEEDGDVLAAQLGSLVALGGEAVETFLLDLLQEPRRLVVDTVDMDIRALAVDGLGDLRAAQASAAIAELLRSDDAYLRSRVAWALQRLTNRQLGRDWADRRLDDETRRRGQRDWTDWLASHGDESRDVWLTDGFAQAGYQVVNGGVDRGVLASAVRAPEPYIRYNAQRILERLLRRDVPSRYWPASDAAWYWQAAVGR